MLENGKQTKQKKRLNLKLVLLFSCALLVCMVITFSITLAYFGGSSDSMSATLYLKAPLEIGKETSQSKLDLTQYMIPGVNVKPTCEITLMSGTHLANFDKNAVTNGLLRAQITFGGAMASYLSEGVTYTDVYRTASVSGMTEANLVARLVKHSDNYWYLVDSTTATTITDQSLLYEVPLSDTSNGTLTLMFYLQFNVSTTFTNEKGGQQATATVAFKAIQSEYYNGTNTALAKTIANYKKVFESE